MSKFFGGRYKEWDSFVFQGKEWLALHGDGGVHILGKGFSNYGAYLDIESFKEMYKRDGESLYLNF